MKTTTTETSTKELSEIIINAIREEPFFTKDVLIPKIRALISGFRLRLATKNYNKIANPNETAKLIRSEELQNLEKIFWMQKLRDNVGRDNMDIYYNELDKERLKWK